MEFFYGENLRLDWGLGNPNKTATLIACLLVCVHVIRYVIPGKKWGLAVFFVVFLGLGICLIHTYSRGGLVAAAIGQLAFWIARYRGKLRFPPKAEVFVGVVLFGVLVIYSALPQVNAASRYTQGIGPQSEEDLSVTNRLRIWKDAPRMMVDAPRGWGLGNAGVSWMQWYQPQETRYRYRTLVNSHLTWLVELGWIGRFFYVFGWGMAFAIIFARRFDEKQHRPTRRSAGVVTGVWAAFAAGALFSSVAESLILWVLPVLGVVWMLVQYRLHPLKQKKWSVLKGESLLMSGIAAGILCVFVMVGLSGEREISIRKSNGVVQIGAGEVANFLIRPDEQVLGRHYGMDIRRNLNDSWMVGDQIPKSGIPDGIKRLVFSGANEMSSKNSGFEGEIVFLNPLNMVKENSGQSRRGRVILGTLRKDPVAKALRFACRNEDFGWDLENSSGKKLYLSNWIKFFPQSQKVSKPGN